MTRSQSVKTLAKNSLLYLGLAIAVVAAIPLLAGLAYGVRLLIPLLIVAALVAIAVSPALRHWFMAEADNSTQYHGLTFPPTGYYVHPAHGWAKAETPGSATVGADALAVAALGSVFSVEPLPMGSRVEQGQLLFTLCCEKRRLEVKSPLSGMVADINREVTGRPALVKDSPYGAGWVVWLEGVNFSGERSRLASGSGIRAWFRGEVDRFTEVLGVSQAAPTMADGGVLSSDLSAHVDDAKWDEIASKFFASTRD
jgi:glycine cleavage system H lipoate-binding protein